MSTPVSPPNSGDDLHQRVADLPAEHSDNARPVADSARPVAADGPAAEDGASRYVAAADRPADFDDPNPYPATAASVDGEDARDRSRPEFAPAETVDTPRTSTVPQTASRPYGAVVADIGVDRATVVNREKERYGGVKIGSAFFGWLAAAGMAAILTSLLTAAGVALSLTTKTSTAEINNQAAAGTGTAKTVGLVGAILLLVVLFVAYYCGGYVAGRMARFNGAKQGLAVWLWGIVFAVVIFVLVKIGGSKYNVLSNLNLPRIPVDEGSLTTAAVIAVAAIIVVTLGAAVLGGLAGMRFHRNVDRAGLAV